MTYSCIHQGVIHYLHGSRTKLIN
ncbi:hypothetical protein Gotri_027437 [Gossypium trilobum]|uniref:Uncharacterized protein n=1 Tax=Gossypium trilobum TaxID=34281 RepID=A0A7J9FI95_9ROSI|nr:hypothetical protein [Gossypium trilobum]